MGLSISNEPYQFHWEKMKNSLEVIRKNSLNQSLCYQPVMAE
jgi:hypothetical protein